MIRGCARLLGYNAASKVVYDKVLPLDAYYDQEHVWDRDDQVQKIGLVRLIGQLFNDDGQLLQSFENRYSVTTGELLDTISVPPEEPEPRSNAPSGDSGSVGEARKTAQPTLPL